MSASDYTELKVLDHLTGKTAFSIPTVYVGLSSTTPAEDGTNVTEPSSGSYARVATSGADWNAAAAGAVDNANDFTFPTATGDWVSAADLTYMVAYDAATTGNLLFYGVLGTAKPVLNGDTAKIAAGAFNITMD